MPSSTITLGEMPNLPLKEAARFLSISATPLRKGLLAGVYPDLGVATVSALLQRGIVERLIADNGEPIPALRLGPIKADESEDQRLYVGYHNDRAILSDEDFMAASDRWWPASGRDLIMAAKIIVVVVGGIIVGVFTVNNDDGDPPQRNEYGQYRYDLTMIGRMVDLVCPVGGNPIADIKFPGTKIGEFAKKVIGLRVLGGEGGSITRI